MIGSFNLANNENNVQIFHTIGTNVWQSWRKPKGCKFAQFLVIGGGGGGGAGASGGANTSRSGGAGGGSSGVSNLFVPLSLFPDELYILVGNGGLGGSPQTNSTGLGGGSGNLTFISYEPNTTNTNVIIASGNIGAGGGFGGAVSSSNAIAGTASTIFTVANGQLIHLSHFNFVVGQAGAGGGNINQSGTAVSLIGYGGITSGGSGGAGVSTTSRNGANITVAGFIPTILGGVVPTSQASSGFSSFSESSINLKFPLFFTGGAGGFSNNSDIGGNGGNGAFGSGGGGGGAGTTGGRGGNGGNGLVIITCW